MARVKSRGICSMHRDGQGLHFGIQSHSHVYRLSASRTHGPTAGPCISFAWFDSDMTRWTWQSRGKLYKSRGSLNRPQDAARVCNSSNLRHRVQNGSEYLGIWKQQIFPRSSIPALSLLGLLKVTPLATATSPFLSCRHFPQHFLRWKCHRDDWTWTGRKWFRNSKQPGLLI